MKKNVSVLAALLLCAALSAQNINQSVQVTNDYITRFSDFQKQGGDLQVPDSLYRFDYNFDYSVFQTPYKGSYEFSPYQIRVTPEPRVPDGKTLYLRAGAGYSFHPQFGLAWQPLQRSDAMVGVVAGLEGFAGKYRTPAQLQPGTDQLGAEFPASVSGHDLSGHFAVNGQYIAEALRISGQLGYEGIFAGRRELVDAGKILTTQSAQMRPLVTPLDAIGSSFNVFSAQARVQSREQGEDQMFYDIRACFRYGTQAYAALNNRSQESNLLLNLSVGPVLQQKYRILIDGTFEMNNVGGMMISRAQTEPEGYAWAGYSTFEASRATLLGSVKPHVEFLLGGVSLDAGVRLDYSSSRIGTNPGTLFTVAPDVSARLPLINADLELFAAVSGGQSVQSLYDAKQLNHFSYRSETAGSIGREKLRVCAGLDGHWGARLQYGVEAGFVSHGGKFLSGWLDVVQADWREIYGEARASWQDERLEINGMLRYAYAKFSAEYAAYAPPAFTADLRGEYNWNRRVWAGAFLRAASARKWLAGNDPIPGYANLGLTGRARITRSLGAWLEAGNLLGMAIERAPGFIEKGPYVTVGLSLSL
ncbi:MAG: hypothetical protein IJV37_05055 [Bacteroidales bacterium]|nr:hypothetical protein [Bacteroidales bacterium]